MPRTLRFLWRAASCGLKTFNLNMREVNSRLQCKNMFAKGSTFYPIANPEPRTPKIKVSWSDHLFFILLTFLYPL